MLNRDILIHHLNKLSLGDFELSSVETDTDGDFVKGFLPDLSFDMVKGRIMETKYYKKFLDDFKTDAYLFKFEEFIGAYKTLYVLSIKKEGFGVSISALVKRVDFYDSFNNYLPCLGFGMLKDMKQRDKELKESFELSYK